MLNIIYDATQLIDGENNNSVRRGIYFVSLNILRELQKRTDVNVRLWTTPSKSYLLNVLKNKYFSSADFFYEKNALVNQFSKFLAKLRVAARNLEKHFFFRKIIWLIIYIGDFFVNYIFSTNWNRLSYAKTCFFSPQEAIPKPFRKERKICRFVILYDTIPFKIANYNIKKENRWFGNLVKNMSPSDYYFAISEATKEDFCRFIPQLIKEHICVTPLAATNMFRPVRNSSLLNDVKRKYKLPDDKKYIFSLCTLEPRKNLTRAVKAFIAFVEKNNIFDLIWIMGGEQYKSFSEQLKRESLRPDLYEKYVLYAGYIDDNDLPVLYSNAEWFVFTSQYEGFGLPPLEAMQCGCPIITSNNSSLPEVVGDAGIMIDWDSDEQHVEAYEKYYFNENLRKENSRKGLARAKQFSWEKTVDKMVASMNANFSGP